MRGKEWLVPWNFQQDRDRYIPRHDLKALNLSHIVYSISSECAKDLEHLIKCAAHIMQRSLSCHTIYNPITVSSLSFFSHTAQLCFIHLPTESCSLSLLWPRGQPAGFTTATHAQASPVKMNSWAHPGNNVWLWYHSWLWCDFTEKEITDCKGCNLRNVIRICLMDWIRRV